MLKLFKRRLTTEQTIRRNTRRFNRLRPDKQQAFMREFGASYEEIGMLAWVWADDLLERAKNPHKYINGRPRKEIPFRDQIICDLTLNVNRK